MVTGGDFATMLDALARDPDERLSVSHRGSNGRFVSEVTTVRRAAEIAGRYSDGDVWYGVGVIHDRVTTGRGTAGDVISLPELFADLDIKPDGMPSEAAAQAVVDDLSEMLVAQPVAVVHSGHGLQPNWTLEGAAGCADLPPLLRRWGRLVAHVAGKRGGEVDNVSI